jgi:LPS sulfotransferase NodH
MAGSEKGWQSPLEGIETGYEERHDFPFRLEPPERVYLMASIPRSGSTFLSHILWKTGCLGAPLEYLNFLPGSPYGFAHQDPAKQNELWRSALQRRTSPNGVFGVKCFPAQLHWTRQNNPDLYVHFMKRMLPHGPSAHVIRLRRRDETAHAISLARASLSGVWRKEQEPEGGAEVAFSEAAFRRAKVLLQSDEEIWNALQGQARFTPLDMWYEDVVSDPALATRSVAAYLGVSLDPGSQVSIPVVDKQGERDALRWAERLSCSNGK